MNLRPAECTTCAVALGAMSKKFKKKVSFLYFYIKYIVCCMMSVTLKLLLLFFLPGIGVDVTGIFTSWSPTICRSTT